MIKTNVGHIVTIASMAGVVGSPGLVDCKKFIELLAL